MARKYLTIVGNRRTWGEFLTQPSGGDDSGKPVAIDPSTGKINTGFVPDSSVPVKAVVASETIANRRLVNFHVSSGPKCRLALGTYAKRAHGYVAVGGNATDVLSVQMSGEVTMDIGATGVTDADFGAPMYLDPVTTGLATKTPPSASGQARQYLGFICGINTGAGTYQLMLHIAESEDIE